MVPPGPAQNVRIGEQIVDLRGWTVRAETNAQSGVKINNWRPCSRIVRSDSHSQSRRARKGGAGEAVESVDPLRIETEFIQPIAGKGSSAGYAREIGIPAIIVGKSIHVSLYVITNLGL